MIEPRVTLVIADDHPLVRSGVRQLIESRPEFHVLAECSDGDDALMAIREYHPAIAIVDLRMPKLDGISVLRAVTAEKLLTQIVLITATISDADVHTAVESGAAGIVLKEWAPDTLLLCLADVAAGRRWLPPTTVIEAFDREVARHRFAEEVVARLTRRERQIALLAAAGVPTKQIAHQCGLSEGTVKVHLHSIFRKLGAASRAELSGIVANIRDRFEHQ
jgi:two-component system, NarL family, nitrate/nitrite response regulator NarL